MNYGSRQEHALYLLKILKEYPNNKLYYKDSSGKKYSTAEIISEIENDTEIGKQIVTSGKGLIST